MLNEMAIAFGGDSSVYRVGDHVRKVYDGGPLSSPVSTRQVELYANISNLAAAYGANCPTKIVFGSRAYIVIFNPITSISETDGAAEISAPFVEGLPLSKRPDVNEARVALFRLSCHLNEVLGTDGIEITPGNAMLCGDQIVITDLCASVRRLKKITP